jgi:hypothetical protein
MQILEQNNTAVVLIDAPPHLELQQESITVSLAEGLQVVDGAAQGQRGPKGDKGDQGDPGVDGVAGSPAYEEIVIPSIAPTEYVLAHEPLTSSLNVFVNGLRQNSSAFNLVVASVSLLSDLQLIEGDLLAFVYDY